jgi:hypothetical protein
MISQAIPRFSSTLARVVPAISAVLLAGSYLLALSQSSSDAATSLPHNGATCAQTADFPSGSAAVGLADDDTGYWIATNDGYVAACGDAPYLGEQTTLNAPIVGIAATEDGGGYYLVASDGGVFAFGDARFQGSMGSMHLDKPVVGMAVDPATGGYWLVASDGGIFAFNAPYLGSTASMTLNKPVVGMSVASNGAGYWLVASDGGVFAYDAPFWGSTGSIYLPDPIVGIGADPESNGYWLASSDGAVFSFYTLFLYGATNNYGSPTISELNAPIVDFVVYAGTGYRFLTANGGVFDYGLAGFWGTPTFAPPSPTPGAT